MFPDSRFPFAIHYVGFIASRPWRHGHDYKGKRSVSIRSKLEFRAKRNRKANTCFYRDYFFPILVCATYPPVPQGNTRSPLSSDESRQSPSDQVQIQNVRDSRPLVATAFGHPSRREQSLPALRAIFLFQSRSSSSSPLHSFASIIIIRSLPSLDDSTIRLPVRPSVEHATLQATESRKHQGRFHALCAGYSESGKRFSSARNPFQ
jgi:hypothetical protein